MNPRRLLTAFQPLAGLAGEAAQEAATGAEAALEEGLPQAYRLPPGGRSSIRPGAAMAGQERALLDELVQHLLDLYYLPETFYEDYFGGAPSGLSSEQWRAIQSALLTWIREDDWAWKAGLFRPAAAAAAGWPGGEELPLLVQRLGRLTSLDGEPLLDRPLRLGERSVYSRVLLYRLRILGQYYDEEPVPDRLDRSALIRTLNVLLMLGRVKRGEIDYQGAELPAALFEQLGDAHAMFKDYRARHRSNLLFYRAGETLDAKAHSQWLIVWKEEFIFGDREKVFERRLRQRTPLDFRQVKEFLAGRGTAATAFHTTQNKLGLRLLQLKLWMAGFYYGRIDGWWGALSHQAFYDLLEQEGQRKEKQLRRFVLPVEGGYRAVNLARLGKLLRRYEAPPTQVDPQQLIEALPLEAEEEIRSALYREDPAIEAFYRESHRNRRRLYFGLRSLVAGVLRGVKKVVDWIRRQVRKVVGAVISFFKAVTKRIREGMLTFAESFRRFLHFVLQRPLFSPDYRTVPVRPNTGFVLTRFALDADTVNLYSRSAPPALLTAHLTLVQGLTSGLSLFLTIAADVIRLFGMLATLTTPIGWIRLGLWVARRVADIVDRKSMGK